MVYNLLLGLGALIASLLIFYFVLSKINEAFTDHFSDQEKENERHSSPTDKQLKWSIIHIRQDLSLLIGLISVVITVLIYIAIVQTFK